VVIRTTPETGEFYPAGAEIAGFPAPHGVVTDALVTVQALAMAKNWMDLSPGTRRLLVISGTFEAVLKIAALIDLARRPADQVRGSKPRWAVAISLVNSFGAVPIAYFVRGRQSSSPGP